MNPNPAVRSEVTLLTEDDLYLFNEGSHFRLYEKLGSRPLLVDGVAGTYFAVWAPNAAEVYVKGDFNDWNNSSHPLAMRGSSGIWEGFVAGVGQGDLYKYRVNSRYDSYFADKADPFAHYNEVPYRTSSIVWDLGYGWGDQGWMQERRQRNALSAPISIYEVHLGSWMRVMEGEDEGWLTYRDLAPRLAEYARKMGFTHVELLPITEHPYLPSWGYQVTGYFAPTSRYGTPQDLMYLIDTLHQQGIGVILDWVPSHFPTDGNGLGYFDGTHLYEHADPRKGFHPDWKSLIFNYDRREVQSFLISSAIFWLDQFHIDGLRVDAVASMLYLDYSRKPGEWIPNEYGGKENIGAIEFMRRLNYTVYKEFPDVQMIAEESTNWNLVSHPTYTGGLGFGMKWDMGWMHDTLHYFSFDPIARRYHHHNLTFRVLYAWKENYILPLSHDEVVHGKGSLIGKMPGDEWQKFANLRALFGYMFAQPAKKLLFMGGEIGQWREWSHARSIDWHLLEQPLHQGLQTWVSDLNHMYTSEPALYEREFDPAGFEWIDCNDIDNSTLSLIRRGNSTNTVILAVCNFTPIPRYDYRVGVPCPGSWQEVLNSDATRYGGSGLGNCGGKPTDDIWMHGRPWSLNLTLPPLSVLFFRSGS